MSSEPEVSQEQISEGGEGLPKETAKTLTIGLEKNSRILGTAQKGGRGSQPDR